MLILHLRTSFVQICDTCYAFGGEIAKTCRLPPPGSRGYSCVNCRCPRHKKCRWYGELQYDHGLNAYCEGRERPPLQPRFRKKTVKIACQAHDSHECRPKNPTKRNSTGASTHSMSTEKLEKMAATMKRLAGSLDELLSGIEARY
jgi:hypothetical protein